MTKKENRAVLLDAAESLLPGASDSVQFSCFAIEDALGRADDQGWGKLTKSYQKLMKPEYSGSLWATDYEMSHEENQNFRCLLVLLFRESL